MPAAEPAAPAASGPRNLVMPFAPTTRVDSEMARSPPRWMLVGDLPPPAHGSSLSFEMLCRELARRGWRCRVVNHGRRRAAPPSRLSAKRCWEVLGVLARFAAGLLAGHRRVYLIISQSGAGFLRDLAMIWSARLFACRVVVHLKGGNYDGFYRSQHPFLRLLIRATVRRADRIIVLSERLRSMYAFEPAVAGRVAVVANGPPIRLRGQPRTLCRQRPARLLYLSNLMQSKGYDRLLDAAAILCREGFPFELVFAGRFLAASDDALPLSAAAAQARFRRRIEAAPLAGAVRYAGPVAGAGKWRLFEQSDFFLLPTAYRHEGQPVSIIEAMAHGCVVIATRFRAIPDLVEDGVTGTLLDGGEPRQIAAAVRELAADPGRYRAMSAAAVRRYEQRFTLDRHLDAMTAVLSTT